MIFHIGFPKAASSTIQYFFNKHPDIFLIDWRKAAFLLTNMNGLLYDRSAVARFLREQNTRSESNGQIAVLSNERFCGSNVSFFYDAKEIADRLYDIAPTAKILILVREQMSMLSSCYKFYVKRGGTKTWNQYFEPTKDIRWPQFDLRNFEYHRFVEYYQSLFGCDKVKVVLVEDMATDPKGFFQQLSEYIGTSTPPEYDLSLKRNENIADRSVEFLRRVNFFTPLRPFDPLYFGGDVHENPNLLQSPLIAKIAGIPIRCLPGTWKHGKNRNIANEIATHYKRFYANSNKLLEQMIGRDLASLGYEVEK